ncbi:universal stress protein [Ruania halotolerans]|uniref:universal stress protein n=1 Tax=Ruania halotolerans TaxID=2897773 RepID=UPI001E459E21|nr:universal stress protein [Ruania halotolerans]UFU08189.1 universal stress protein [Ruania halotolerans]
MQKDVRERVDTDGESHISPPSPGYVVGVDGSAASRAALGWALRTARGNDSSARLVAVVDSEWATVGESTFTHLRETVEATLDRELRWAREAEPSVQATSRLQVGAPVPELARAAATATMLVVGTHKSGYFRGRALGARSLQLATCTSVPLAIVPASGERRRRGVIVAGAGDGAGAAIAFAADECDRTGERLIVVCSSPTAERTHVVHAAEQRARAAAPRIDIEVRWTDRDPAEALIVHSSSAALTVIGRRHPDVAPLGRIAIELILNLAGPVVLVPER